MRLHATGAAAKATGDLNQVAPLIGQACLATLPIQTLSAGSCTRQRSTVEGTARMESGQLVIWNPPYCVERLA